MREIVCVSDVYMYTKESPRMNESVIPHGTVKLTSLVYFHFNNTILETKS